MRRILALAAVGALFAPASATAVATPLAPAPGAVVETSHPVFTWSLPASEEPDGIYLANAPGTTIEGKLFDENIVDLDIFFGGETSWSPSSPLPAGTYWWNVWSHDPDSWTSYYSAPASFTIPPRVRITSIKVRRYGFIHNLDITVAFAANTDSARVSVRARRGSRTVWSRTETDDYVSIGGTDTAYFSWYTRGRIQPGTPLRLTVTVEADGARASATKTVRAP